MRADFELSRAQVRHVGNVSRGNLAWADSPRPSRCYTRFLLTTSSQILILTLPTEFPSWNSGSTFWLMHSNVDAPFAFDILTSGP